MGDTSGRYLLETENVIKFNINGEDWKILIVSSNHPALERPDGSYTLGCCDDDKKSIYIILNYKKF